MVDLYLLQKLYKIIIIDIDSILRPVKNSTIFPSYYLILVYALKNAFHQNFYNLLFSK